MPDISLTAKVAKLSRPEKMFFDTILKKSDENIFTAIKDLRKGFAEDSIEPQFKEAATLALTAMTAHLNGDDEGPFLSDDDALSDLKERLETARTEGDQETYDSLKSGLNHAETKAAKSKELNERRIAELESSNEAHAAAKKTQYQDMLDSAKDRALNGYRRQGMDHAQAELHYQEWAQKTTEAACQRATGYTPPREPIPAE
jgi:Fic family protein